MPRSSASRGEANDHRLAVDRDLAARRTVDAREDLDQRRFAGAVVAEQAMDLAELDLERDVAQRDHRAEELGDAAQLEEALIRTVGHRRFTGHR